MKSFKKQLYKWKYDNEKQGQTKRTEKLTDREIKELMGINRATYIREKGGAFRQK